MILILVLASIFSISAFFNLPLKLSEQALVLHHFCLRSLPSTVENLSSLEALVCGKNMQDLELKHLLVQSSLIHIFIVSGSHFLFLRKILAHIPILRIYPLLPLGLYALVTLCQPPSLRSLIFLALLEIFERRQLVLNQVLLVLLSGLLCVSLFPQWIWSRSLQMSLVAALILVVAGEFWKKQNSLAAHFLTQSALFFGMGFCVLGFGNLHPLSILLNMILGPLIGAVVFPLALLTVFLPFLGRVFDGAIHTLTWVLQKCAPILGEGHNQQALPLLWQWLFFAGLVIASHHFLVGQKRKQARNA